MNTGGTPALRACRFELHCGRFGGTPPGFEPHYERFDLFFIIS